MTGPYQVGDVVRVQTTFTSVGGTNNDPTAVTFSYLAPSDTTVTTTSPTKASTGIYYVDLSLDESGWWAWRFEGTGTAAAADEGRLYVDPTLLT